MKERFGQLIVGHERDKQSANRRAGLTIRLWKNHSSGTCAVILHIDLAQLLFRHHQRWFRRLALWMPNVTHGLRLVSIRGQSPSLATNRNFHWLRLEPGRGCRIPGSRGRTKDRRTAPKARNTSRRGGRRPRGRAGGTRWRPVSLHFPHRWLATVAVHPQPGASTVQQSCRCAHLALRPNKSKIQLSDNAHQPSERASE